LNVSATAQSPDKRLVFIAVNPRAGARSGRPDVDHLASDLRELDYQVEILSDLDELSARTSEEQLAGRLRVVVSAGGDGTISTIVNRTIAGIPLTILPLGTENLLAKYVGLSSGVHTVRDAIHQGVSIQLDAGQVDDRIFLLMVSCGFDADVVQRLHADRQGHIHHFDYAKPILDSIRNYEYPELRLSCEGETAGVETEPIIARWAFIVNLPRYAFGLNLAPDAIGTDGLVDVCTFSGGSLWNGLRYLGGVMLGTHQNSPECVTCQTSTVRIEADTPVPYQLDGDPGGVLPMTIGVLPGRLNLVVPPRNAQQLGFQLPD
jgi:diacylglycerol kinase (ATP)